MNAGSASKIAHAFEKFLSARWNYFNHFFFFYLSLFPFTGAVLIKLLRVGALLFFLETVAGLRIGKS